VISYDVMWIAATAINMTGSTGPTATKNVLPTVFKIYRGISDPDMSVDDDGIQRTQKYQPFIFENWKDNKYDVTF
jgi:hypothetical protein